MNTMIFVILPDYEWYQLNEWQLKGGKVVENFSYSSVENSHWLDSEAISKFWRRCLFDCLMLRANIVWPFVLARTDSDWFRLNFVDMIIQELIITVFSQVDIQQF